MSRTLILITVALALSACTEPSPPVVPTPATERPMQHQGIDALEVEEVGSSVLRVTDAAAVDRVLHAMVRSDQPPSGGKRRWTVRCLASGKLVAEVFVYPDGEWGYGGRTRGRSPALVTALDEL